MKLRKFNNASKLAALIALAPLALFSCTGDTGGGSAADAAHIADPFVDNGGAGAKLELTIDSADRAVGVGEVVEYRVHVTDPQGVPLQFVKVFCDTEQGVAIIEPSLNGVALESTNSRGYVSGSIGGVTPGSFAMECRTQSGFNLVDKTTIRVTGTVPAGFQGFPGAAGGHLGGGKIVDETPTVNDGNGVRITSVAVSDSSSSTGTNSGPLDIQQNICVVASTTVGAAPTCTAEPFVFNTFTLTLKNDTNTNVFLNTVEVRLGGTTVVSQQGVPQEIEKGGKTATISGQLTTGINCGSDKCYNTGGTNNLEISQGSRNYTFIVTGTAEDGNSFEIRRTASIQFDRVNNCPAGSTPQTSCS